MDINAYIAGAKKKVEGEHKAWTDDLLSRLPNNAVIFEIGSATNRDAEYMKKTKPSITVVSSDKEEGFVQHIQNRGREAIVFDILQDEFDPREKYDAFYAHMVVLHFTLVELKQMLIKMISVLKKEGIIALSFATGDKDELEEWNRVEGNIFTRFHSPEEIDKIANRLGISKVYFKEVPDKKRWYASYQKL